MFHEIILEQIYFTFQLLKKLFNERYLYNYELHNPGYKRMNDAKIMVNNILESES